VVLWCCLCDNQEHAIFITEITQVVDLMMHILTDVLVVVFLG